MQQRRAAFFLSILILSHSDSVLDSESGTDFICKYLFGYDAVLHIDNNSTSRFLSSNHTVTSEQIVTADR